MATYPTLITAPGSDPDPIKSAVIDRAEDGTARARYFMTTSKVKISVRHDNLSQADKDTLDAFYEANKLLEFDYTSPADGVLRSMLFGETPPKYVRRVGARYDAIVEMEEA